MSEKNYPVAIDEAALKAKLDPLSYEVLRNAATERPFTGEYTDTDKVGDCNIGNTPDQNCHEEEQIEGLSFIY